MASQVSINEWAALDKYDISGQVSNFASQRMVALNPCTTFPPATSGTQTRVYKQQLPGAEDAKMSIAGYLDTATAAAIDALFAGIFTVTKGDGRDPGDTCLMYQAIEAGTSTGGPVGMPVPFTADIESTGPVCPGFVYTFGTITATGNSATRTPPALSVGKSRTLHAHVITVGGTGSPTLTLTYETSAIGDFSDAVTRVTFSNFTAAGVQRVVDTGITTDTNGRFKWVISGTTPSFLVRFCEGVR